MAHPRVIPCLLLQGRGLVKTLRFDRPKYVGDPINAIRIFNDKEVDELMVLDIVASRQRGEPDFELIQQFASECFMPVCYGGGIRTLAQVEQLFRIGIEKVCIQTAGLDHPDLIRAVADNFGSQSVVASIDVKRNWLGRAKVYGSASRQLRDLPWQEQVDRAAAAGAGEILLNSVDRDGTMQGLDLVLIREASDRLSIPLIAVGGVGSLQDIQAGIAAGADAIAAGAFFVFHGPHRAVLISYPDPADLRALSRPTS
jgi:cyclase